MARSHYSDDSYDSDNSTLVNSPRGKRRRPHRTRSEESPYFERPRPGRRHSSYTSQKSHSKWQSAGKVALGVAFVGIVAEVVNRWVKNREAQNAKHEEERIREKKRQFEKAKAKRRREEDRREKERESRDRRERDNNVWEEVVETRRIGYLPTEDRGRSQSAAPRRLEAPPSREASASREEWEDDHGQDDPQERSARNHRSRSRPAVGVT